MKYISTRSNSIPRTFKEIIIAGTAEDGGLYIPESLPTINKKDLLNLSYIEMATSIISSFAPEIDKEKIKNCCERAYNSFKNGIVPIKKLENDLYMVELFQGPTLSFKDYAMQFLGQMIDEILSESQTKKQIITATSGDTGPAAIYGFKDCKWVDIKVYFPNNNVSKMQRDQMTSLKQENIEAIPMDTTFDECQKIVKESFANDKTGNLMTVNSINFGRIVAQIVYYFWIEAKFNNEELKFYVPTGNFGNIFAAYLAKQLGVNAKLNICVNENDTLYRFCETGIYQPKEVISTSANAIDIANPSNFERILYYFSNDKKDVSKYIKDLKEKGFFKVSDELLEKFRETFKVYKTSEKEIKNTQELIKNKYKANICPHTAVAMFPALNNNSNDIKKVVLGTADYRKFL